MYQQVQVEYNNTPVNSPVNSYSYLAYFSTLLNYGSDAKNSHLQCSLWSKDTASEFDNLVNSKVDNANKAQKYNNGFLERGKAVALSKPFELYSRLHVGAFNTDR